MTKYKVTFNDSSEQVFNSITKAYEAIEQSFQCGAEQSLQEIKKSIKNSGLTQVRHCMCGTVNCWLEVA